ncbi:MULTISPECIES: type II toxin-antitoxin system VapC family toxin [unclassified Gluconobacter]|uniref:type II toxin-antitoxin system VapC family toxin n=1 Tax=unclassified Gluconobacter TaxID=2644261 RepID=UPI00351C9E4F
MDFTPDDDLDSLEKRFDFLLKDLDHDDSEIIIPAPVIAEVLCASTIDPRNVMKILNQEVRVRVVAFGQRAAEEFGQIFRKTHRGSENRNSFRFDLLIIATAKAEGVDIVYSSDGGVINKCNAKQIRCYSFQKLPRPPFQKQRDLQLDAHPDGIQ